MMLRRIRAEYISTLGIHKYLDDDNRYGTLFPKKMYIHKVYLRYPLYDVGSFKVFPFFLLA